MAWLKNPRIANILSQKDGEISFEVDSVVPCEELLKTVDAKEVLKKKYGPELLAFSHENTRFVSEVSGNPLVSAIHLAFAQHYPIELCPDDVWLTIAQGFARHINLNAEYLSERFVRHNGKKELEVSCLPPTSNDTWRAVIDKLAGRLDKELGPGLPRLMRCDFTTTTKNSLAASQIVLLDAFQQYFDYAIYYICGIPRITLRGTPEDWSKIRDRVRVIEEYDLSWWTKRLMPICDELIVTAEGRPRRRFWQHIFSPKEIYGGEVITGWIVDLFPYLRTPDGFDECSKNEFLEIPRSQLSAKRLANSILGTKGIFPDRLPLGFSQVPVLVKSSASEQKEYIDLLAGFIGVYQDRTTGTLRPEIGWLISPQANSGKGEHLNQE